MGFQSSSQCGKHHDISFSYSPRSTPHLHTNFKVFKTQVLHAVKWQKILIGVLHSGHLSISHWVTQTGQIRFCPRNLLRFLRTGDTSPQSRMSLHCRPFKILHDVVNISKDFQGGFFACTNSEKDVDSKTLATSAVSILHILFCRHRTAYSFNA